MVGTKLVAAAVATVLTSGLLVSPATAGTPGWEVLPTPSPGAGLNELVSVSGTSANDVWAVGSYEVKPHIPEYPAAMHWDGSSWQQFDVPVPAGATRVKLAAVDAITPGNVWAVGSTGTPATRSKNLITHWNGNAWDLVSAPNFGSEANRLNGIAAVSANDIWAVGGSDGNNSQATMLHWDGQSWSVVGIPAANNSRLSDITARAANDVWAVGAATSSNPAQEIEPYVLHWDGSSWTRVTTPNTSPLRDEGVWLRDVAVGSDGTVVATGHAQSYNWIGSLENRPEMLRYDGSTWSFVTPPHGFLTKGTSIHDVAIDASGNPWITGLPTGGGSFSMLSGGAWTSFEGADPDAWRGPSIQAITVVERRVWAVGMFEPSSEELSKTYAERSPAM